MNSFEHSPSLGRHYIAIRPIHFQRPGKRDAVSWYASHHSNHPWKAIFYDDILYDELKAIVDSDDEPKKKKGKDKSKKSGKKSSKKDKKKNRS